MRLERLEIKGFKSFRDKTVLEFPDRFMGIVGPNGSGKSNITESICFVLGKSRGLRAANLTELIFNGGIGGEPSQKATVSLTLKDNDGRKYKITRIVEQDGTSVYKLDDKRTTRQDILQIVGDSEYNILLQDDITKVVEMKPQQRRQVIDDLCGIGEYDEKRDKALRELEKVEEKINQTTIILGQKQGYMTSLKKERDEALRYTNARDELTKSKATLLYKEISSLEKRDEKISESTKQLEDERRQNLDRVSDIKSEIAEKTNRFKEIGRKLLSLEEERRGTKIAEAKGEILRAEDKLKILSERDEELAAEEKQKKEQLDGYTRENRKTEENITECDKNIVALNGELERESAKTSDQGVENEVDEVKNRVYEARSSVKALTELTEKLKQDRKTYEIERGSLEDRIKSEVGDEKGSIKSFEDTRTAYEKTLTDYRKYDEEYNRLTQETRETGELLQKHQIVLNRKQSELDAIVNASGGLHKAVKSVLELK
ncbi:MAG: AAA family ATPase, partial [Candidatus Altiarchaeota archaeon]|nr:AAA family ATPase [Candidatus Altiarchaeota archaeon]